MSFIILDRDGVINYNSSEYIKSPDEWIAIPGSLEAIATLNRAGFRVVIVTNQSGIARGYYDADMLDQIHEKLTYELATVGGFVDDIFYCPHHPLDNCACRKPKPALFYEIKKKYNIDLSQTFFIGDSSTDIEASIAAGCKPLLVLTGHGKQTRTEHPELCSTLLCFENLAEAVLHILKESNYL